MGQVARLEWSRNRALSSVARGTLDFSLSDLDTFTKFAVLLERDMKAHHIAQNIAQKPLIAENAVIVVLNNAYNVKSVAQIVDFLSPKV